MAFHPRWYSIRNIAGIRTQSEGCEVYALLGCRRAIEFLVQWPATKYFENTNFRWSTRIVNAYFLIAVVRCPCTHKQLDNIWCNCIKSLILLLPAIDERFQVWKAFKRSNLKNRFQAIKDWCFVTSVQVFSVWLKIHRTKSIILANNILF